MSARFCAYEYDIALARPVQVAGRTLAKRQGIVCHWPEEHVFCDIAPLPGVHAESLAEVKGLLFEFEELLELWRGVYDLESASPSIDIPSGVCGRLMQRTQALPRTMQFALEQIRLQRHPAIRYRDLCQNFNLKRAGLIDLTSDPSTADVERLRSTPNNRLKLKLNPHDSKWQNRLEGIFESGLKKDTLLRVDLNRQMSFGQFKVFFDDLMSIAKGAIDFIEEPVSDLGAWALLEWIDGRVEIGFDESLWPTSCHQWPRFGVLVLKPSCIEQISTLIPHLLVRRHDQNQIQIQRMVLSNPYESCFSFGVYQYIADRLNLIQEVHGFGSADLFTTEPILCGPRGDFRLNESVLMRCCL